jgi:hypothetical protein
MSLDSNYCNRKKCIISSCNELKFIVDDVYTVKEIVVVFITDCFYWAISFFIQAHIVTITEFFWILFWCHNFILYTQCPIIPLLPVYLIFLLSLCYTINLHSEDRRGSDQYGSWTYNYLCNQFLSPLILWIRTPFRRSVLDTTLCHRVCQ